MYEGYINIELDLFDYVKKFKVSKEKMLKAYQAPRIKELIETKQFLIEVGLPNRPDINNLFDSYIIHQELAVGRLNYIDFERNLVDVTIKKEFADHLNNYISLICMENKANNQFHIIKPVLLIKNKN